MSGNLGYSIDLSTAQARAEKVAECIKALREQYDRRRLDTSTSGLRRQSWPKSAWGESL
jgi:hypothetical protein